MLGKKGKKLVFIGSDHAGFKEKEALHKHLVDAGYDATDLGTFTEESCDYPDIAREVGEKVKEHEGSFGILLCGSGVGMSIAANRLRGVRAALAMDENIAELSRKHNNANVLALAARFTKPEMLIKITDKFLKTEFEKNEERHVRRVKKMDEM